MLEALSDKLSGVFQKLGSHGSITEKDLDEAMREVRIALLEADVNFKVVRQFVAAVRERALGAEGMKSLSGTQQVIAIVNEDLVNILGGSPSTLAMASKPPTVIMLVLDAMTGQEAVNVAQEFHDQLNVTGIIVTKMDGDARGGAVLSIRAVSGLPVKFMGTGEKSDALEPFYPDRFASRILGMG